MEHHFSDFLDRTLGHWTFTENRLRWKFQFDDLAEVQSDFRCLTVSKTTKNWRLLSEFSDLEELTLDRPSPQQVEWIQNLPRLKRLRLSFSRVKSLDVLGAMPDLEELILEYTSGIRDLSALATLTNLRSLHLENLRNVSDFSDLKELGTLRALGIRGTFDAAQKIENLNFLSSLKKLEQLSISSSRVFDETGLKEAIQGLGCIKKFSFSADQFELEFFAWLSVVFPDVQGATRDPYWISGGKMQRVQEGHKLATMPVEELQRVAPDIVIKDNGDRWRPSPIEAHLLGRGQRVAQGKRSTVEAKATQHATEYERLQQGFRLNSIPSG